MKTDSTRSFAFHIHEILGGKEYRKVKDGYSHASLKSTLLRTTKAIRHAIEENLKVIDPPHLRHMTSCVELAESQLKSTKSEIELFEIYTAFQGKLIFLLLGEAPMRREGFSNRRENWKLDRHRSVIYTQNEEQKTKLLDSYIQNHLIGEGKIFESHSDYFTFEYSPLRIKNRDVFLHWLKDEHFSEYETLIKELV
jgi:hypothetical protein